MDSPIERHSFDASTLIKEEPAQLFSRNKRIVYELACPPDAVHHGKVNYSRWKSMVLPGSVSVKGLSESIVLRDGYYDYIPIHGTPKAFEWHVNFADPDLFLAYGSDLLAQDEIDFTSPVQLAAWLRTAEATLLGHLTENQP